MWPWWLICFAGIFVVLFWELFLVFLRWGEKKGVACGVCGYLWWCLSSPNAKLYFCLAYLLKQVTAVHAYLRWWIILVLPLVIMAVQILLILLNRFWWPIILLN
jgi:hypothetical protein